MRKDTADIWGIRLGTVAPGDYEAFCIIDALDCRSSWSCLFSPYSGLRVSERLRSHWLGAIHRVRVFHSTLCSWSLLLASTSCPQSLYCWSCPLRSFAGHVLGSGQSFGGVLAMVAARHAGAWTPFGATKPVEATGNSVVSYTGQRWHWACRSIWTCLFGQFVDRGCQPRQNGKARLRSC